MKQNYFKKILIIICVLNISGNIYGQSAEAKNPIFKESENLSDDLDFGALFHQIESQQYFQSVLLQKELSQIHIKSNDRVALDTFLNKHESILGMNIIKNGNKNPGNYYQVDLNVSISSFQVEIILSEVKGQIFEEKKRVWVSIPNFQLR